MTQHMTSEIFLKIITADKLEKIMNWRTSPEVSSYMYTNHNLSIEDQKKWFKNINNDSTVSYWIIVVDRIDVGVLNLYDIDMKNKRCFWAYYIGDSSARGKGVARQLECNIYDYVFYEMGLNKLCCEVLAFNEKVIQIHEKFGSEIEGVFKQHIFKNNTFLDVVRMGILKEKWDEIKSQYEYRKIPIYT